MATMHFIIVFQTLAFHYLNNEYRQENSDDLTYCAYCSFLSNSVEFFGKYQFEQAYYSTAILINSKIL